jgi:hypothetical protein
LSFLSLLTNWRADFFLSFFLSFILSFLFYCTVIISQNPDARLALVLRASCSQWVRTCGGGDFASANLFFQLWRRTHSYTAPAVGAVQDSAALWRSQMPPDGPNFVAVGVDLLKQSADDAAMLLQQSGIASKLGPIAAVREQMASARARVMAVPAPSFCELLCGGPDAYLARLDGALDFTVDALSAASAPAGGPTFGVTVPADAMPGALLTVQQPDGQVVQVAVPAVCAPGATLSVPTRPFASAGAVALHVMVYHVSILEHDWIVFETPPVLPVSGSAPSEGLVTPNPLWTGTAPALQPAEFTAVAHFYDQSRCVAGPAGVAVSASGRVADYSRTLAIAQAAANALDAIPEATLWVPDVPSAPPIMQQQQQQQYAMAGGGAVGGIVAGGGGLQMGPVVAAAVVVDRNAPFGVIVPPNGKPGDSIVVQSPTGCVFSVELPPGATPGAQLLVQMPDAFDGVPGTRLVGALDTDGDGMQDTVGLDTNGDGQVDTYRSCVLLDTNGDGVFDSMSFDSTGDGMRDQVVKTSSVPEMKVGS